MYDSAGLSGDDKPVSIVVTGAESTGKTTLGRALAESMGVPFVPEFLRQFVDEAGRLPREEDVFAISAGYLEARNEALSSGAPAVVFDTDLISTVLYQRYYFGDCPPSIIQLSRETEALCYLLCGDEISWEPDPGQRESREVRAELQVAFRKELTDRRLKFVELTGPLPIRLSAARMEVMTRFPSLAS